MGGKFQAVVATLLAILAVSGSLNVATARAQDASDEAALAEIKTYMTTKVDALVVGANDLNAWAQAYHDLAGASGFDYQAMWEANKATLPATLAEGRVLWAEQVHGNYEKAEGLVAGIPSLVDYDIWLDAGPSEAEDAANARDWTLTLPDGTGLVKPGNIFHSITEPTLWGTAPAYTALEIDMNGDGTVERGEALPNANVLLGATRTTVDVSTQLQTAVAAWTPTLSDAFTALTVMVPTAQGYFEQWALSPFVTGDDSEQAAFVGGSRLVDVLGIYVGLDVTWKQLAPLLQGENPDLAAQISEDLASLIAFVRDLQAQEQAGTTFTPEQAEQFGRQVQSQADTIAGNIGQAAALLEIEIQSI